MLPDFFRAIGADRYLTLDEAAAHGRDRRGGPARAPATGTIGLTEAWDLYQNCFDGFCETTLDPQFHRLTHPTAHVGSIHLDRNEPVIVVGTGPSLQTHAADLARVRPYVRLFTSPRGADVLARLGLEPDLVLIEHRTALDAHHSARGVLDGGDTVPANRAYIATDWRTPEALVGAADKQRLFVPEDLPTWGLWPATLVAMAIASGSSRVGLLGIDLGTAERPNPRFAPLGRLLAYLACASPVTAIDCGSGGAGKTGWIRGTVDDLAGLTALRPMACSRRTAPPAAYRRAVAFTAITGLSRHVDAARRALETALRARAGHVDVDALRGHLSELLAWRTDPNVRAAIQETLGVSFLPRIWRTTADPTAMDASAWRPVLLAAHEFVTQADRLSSALLKAAA